MPARSDADKRVILHVVAYDVSRGAERYARALVDVMNARGPDEHLLLTMFSGDEDNLGADIALGVPRGAWRRLGFDMRVVTRMRSEVARTSPVAIVCHGGEPAKYVAFAVGGTVPFVYLVIGSSHPLLRNPIRRAMRDFYVRRAAAIVTVSSALADEVEQELGVQRDHIHVIPNGRDPEVFVPGDRTSQRIPHVLFVGHLDDQKRPELFIETMGAVGDRGVKATAAMAGGGPRFDGLQASAASSGVELLGPRDDVPLLLAGADMLMLTSRPPEGMPGVLIEAGLAGLPVVSTDVPGARDVVVDGVTGCIVDIDDHAGLADAAVSLLTDEELRRRMGRAARDRCLAEFSLTASADAWDRVLSEVRK